MLTYLQNEISMDHKGQDRCLCTYSVQNINSYELVPGTAVT